MNIFKRHEFLAAGLTFLGCAVIFTWPLCLHFTSAIPAGSEPPAVALVHLFGPEWTGQALGQHKSYWNAPFFYPYQGAFAWGEPEPFFCVLVWLIAKFTGYIAAYNLAIFIYLLSSGMIGYLAARLLTRDRVASLWCGIWLTCGAFFLQQLCATPLLATVFPFACILCAFLSVKNDDIRYFWAGIFMYLLTWFTCKQTAFYLSLLLPVALVPYLSSIKWRVSLLAHLLLAVAVSVAILLPYSLSQLSYTRPMGFERSLSEAIHGSLRLEHLFLPAKGHWLTTRILNRNFLSWDIGMIPVLAILSAVLLGFLKNNAPDAFQKRMRIGLLAITAAALCIGFGPRINGGVFFRLIPGGNFIRIPARAVIFAIFGVAVLSADSFSYLRSFFKPQIIRRLLTLAFFILLSAEMWTIPIGLVFPGDEIAAHAGAIKWLHDNGGGRAVLELPLPASFHTADLEGEAGAQLRMLIHENPVINGYASFAPTSRIQLRKAFASGVSGRARRYMDAYGVRLAVVHSNELSDREKVLYALAFEGCDIVYRDSQDCIYLFPEKKPVSDMRVFLPSMADFGKKVPSVGATYGILLNAPVIKAILITPQQDRRIEFRWIDKQGLAKTKIINIRGCVIMDPGQDRFYVQIISLPRGNNMGEARLVPIDDKI